MRREGLTDFKIRDQLPGGEFTPSPERGEYFPITYTLPRKTLQKVQGFDIQSEKRRRQVIAASRDSGEARLLAPVPLLAEKQGDGFILYLPVYHGDPSTQEERRKYLRGYVATGYIIQKMLGRYLDNASDEGIRLTLTVSSQTGSEFPPALFTVGSEEHMSAQSPANNPFEKSFLFAGSVVVLSFTQSTDFILSRHHWTLWALLTGEALLMALIAGFILATTGRIDTVQLLVGEKTEALAASEYQLKSVISHMGDGLITIDEQGIIQLFNPACERIFGYMASEIIGKNISMLMPEPHRHQHNNYLESYRTNGTSNVIGMAREFRAVRANGEIFPIEIIITEMQLKNGTRYTATLRDISERKHAEEAGLKMEEELRLSRERLELGWKGAGDGMWDWDVRSNVVIFSDRMKELMGYAPHELEHHFDEWANRLHSEDREHTFSVLDNHLKGEGPYDVEYRLKMKSGEWRWFQARGQAIWDEEGQPIRMAGSLTDITERKFAENIRERLIKQLTDANEQLEQFAYVASHDMREPLRIVVSFTDLLLKEST